MLNARFSCVVYSTYCPICNTVADTVYTRPSLIFFFSLQFEIEMAIVHQFQFSSTLQRMSVVTRILGSQDFVLYCKGSPEMIVSLSQPQTGEALTETV